MRDLRTTLLSPGCFLAALAAILDRAGMPRFRRRRNGFATLLHIILEQQVSIDAAAAMHRRLSGLCRPLAPQPFLALDSAGTPVPIAPHGIISKILQEDGSREEEGVPWLQRSAFWWCLL